MTIEEAIASFKPGLYKHYKGGLYTAVCLVTHHEGRYPMVLYIGHSYGGMNVRPLVGQVNDSDGWIGMVPVVSNITDKHMLVPRFSYIGELPSDTPAADRL